jgi:hypothetical protein
MLTCKKRVKFELVKVRMRYSSYRNSDIPYFLWYEFPYRCSIDSHRNLIIVSVPKHKNEKIIFTEVMKNLHIRQERVWRCTWELWARTGLSISFELKTRINSREPAYHHIFFRYRNYKTVDVNWRSLYSLDTRIIWCDVIKLMNIKWKRFKL